MTLHCSPGSKSRWLTVDLHVHSVYSGGVLTPREILETAQRRLLDAIAITDHFTIQGAMEARDLANGTPSFPIGLVAQEISGGEHFHFLMIGSGETPPNLKGQHFTERIADHHAKGGITILAHPWTIARNRWAKNCVADLINAGLLDGIEFFNASILEMQGAAERMETVFQEYWEEWVKPNHLAVTGGSDFHYYRNGREIGKGRTYIKVNQINEMEILESLRAGRCVAGLVTDALIPFSWANGGNSVLWGDEPWLGELQQLIQTIKHYLHGNYLNGTLKRLLAALLAGGHYQAAGDCLNYGLQTLGSSQRYKYKSKF